MERFYYQKKKRKVMGLRKKKVGTKSFDFQIGILMFYEHKVNNKTRFIIYKLDIFRRKNLKNQKIWRSPLTTTNLTLSLRLEEEQ